MVQNTAISNNAITAEASTSSCNNSRNLLEQRADGQQNTAISIIQDAIQQKL
jgi:hypothetical protein